MTDKINEWLKAKFGNGIIIISISIALLLLCLFFVLGLPSAPYYFNRHAEAGIGVIKEITEGHQREQARVSVRTGRRSWRTQWHNYFVNAFVFHFDGDGYAFPRVSVPDGGFYITDGAVRPVIPREWHKTDDAWTDENTSWQSSDDEDWIRIHRPTQRVVSTARQEWESILRATNIEKANLKTIDSLKRVYEEFKPLSVQREVQRERQRRLNSLEQIRNRAENYLTPQRQIIRIAIQARGNDRISNYQYLIGEMVEYKYFWSQGDARHHWINTKTFLEIKHNGEVIYQNPRRQQFVIFSIVGLLGLLVGVWSIRLWQHKKN